jgi:hypothetical protein
MAKSGGLKNSHHGVGFSSHWNRHQGRTPAQGATVGDVFGEPDLFKLWLGLRDLAAFDVPDAALALSAGRLFDPSGAQPAFNAGAAAARRSMPAKRGTLRSTPLSRNQTSVSEMRSMRAWPSFSPGA